MDDGALIMGNDDDDDDDDYDDDDEFTVADLPEDVKRDPIVSKFAHLDPRKMAAAEKKALQVTPAVAAPAKSQ